MKIAVASDTPDTNAEVSMHGARAAFYFVFDDTGNLIRKLETPLTRLSAVPDHGLQACSPMPVLTKSLPGSLVRDSKPSWKALG